MQTFIIVIVKYIQQPIQNIKIIRYSIKSKWRESEKVFVCLLLVWVYLSLIWIDADVTTKHIKMLQAQKPLFIYFSFLWYKNE